MIAAEGVLPVEIVRVPAKLSEEQRNAIADRAFEFFDVPPRERWEGLAAHIIRLTEEALTVGVAPARKPHYTKADCPVGCGSWDCKFCGEHEREDAAGVLGTPATCPSCGVFRDEHSRLNHYSGCTTGVRVGAPTDDELMELARAECENFRWPSTALSIMRKAIAASVDLPVEADPTEKHFRERIDFYADKHPALLARQLATLLRDAWRAARGVLGTPETKLEVWFDAMPESNGKANWTAILHRGDLVPGHTIARSEHHDRVRFEADRVRWLIGELANEPDLLAYDPDMLSPAGWQHPSVRVDAVATAAPEQCKWCSLVQHHPCRTNRENRAQRRARERAERKAALKAQLKVKA